MLKLSRFVSLVIRSFLKDLGLVGTIISIISLIAAFFLIALPQQMPVWITPFWSRISGIIVIFILILRGAYKVWIDADADREKLQTEKDSKESNVELTNFDPELRYRIMNRNERPVVAIRLFGILRNNSSQNVGSLDFFRLEVSTSKGSFVAKSDNPPLGYKFEPNSIFQRDLFVFTGELADPTIGIQSWEPYIKSANGRINLEVQGQKIKSYPIKIADEEGF